MALKKHKKRSRFLLSEWNPHYPEKEGYSKYLYFFSIPMRLPSLNELIEMSKQHWSKYATRKKVLTEGIIYVIRSAGIPQNLGKIDIDITWVEPNRKRDKDNIAGGGTKIILDALVEANIIKNDGWKNIGSITHHFWVDKGNPYIKVRLIPYKNLMENKLGGING